MSSSETYHRTSEGVPFTGICGAKTTVARNGHALTSVASVVTCAECRKLQGVDFEKRDAELCERGPKIRAMRAEGIPVPQIAEQFKIHKSHVYAICRGETR